MQVCENICCPMRVFTTHCVELVTMAVFSPKAYCTVYVIYLLACGKCSTHNVELVTMAEFSPKAHSASVCTVFIGM